MNLTRTQFEAQLPAFRQPDDAPQLYDKLQPYITRAAEELAILVPDTYLTESDTLIDLAQKQISSQAAYHALPQLDLILTPTGFGIVSNQNLAPASKERVAALREQLRLDKSLYRDQLLFRLLEDSPQYRSTTYAHDLISTLLYTPTHLRRYGVKQQGQPTFDEEAQALRPQLTLAEESLTSLISPQLYDHLLEQLRLTQPSHLATEQPTLALLIERSRRYLALFLSQPAPHALTRLARLLLDTVRQGHYEEYLNSNTYAAQVAPRYQNQQTDRTYFF